MRSPTRSAARERRRRTVSELDGIALRNVIADDYRRNAESLGGSVSEEECQRLAAADLELVDRLEREAKPRRSHPLVVEEEPVEEPEKAAQMADAINGRFERRDVDENEPKKVETLANIDHEKRLKLTRRIWEIAQRDPNTGDWHHPALALELQVVHANWNFGVREYARARTQKERDQIFFRQLENLCDKSTGRLGPWWVK